VLSVVLCAVCPPPTHTHTLPAVQGVSALLRTAVLSSPEEALTAAEVDDRRLGHLGRVIR
jgi:hypothetical protein